MFPLLLITTTCLALSCNPACKSLCQELNGRASCYKSCSCPESPSKPADAKLKSELASYINLKYVCDIKDVEKCETSSSNEEEFYECLEQVRCLVYNDGAKLLETIPKALRLAVQPSYILFNDQGTCDSCKDEYYADDFYACVYYNCQKRLSQVKGLVKVAKRNECRDCGIGENESNFCVWQECRQDFVNKENLVVDGEGKNMTCKDCEKIVFADDYYNCIALYCNSLWSQDDLQEVTKKNESKCALCDALSDEEELLKTCEKFSCKSEILSLLKLDLSNLPNNCNNLIGESYEACISAATSSSTSYFSLLLTLTLLLLLLLILSTILFKRPTQDFQVYTLITS